MRYLTGFVSALGPQLGGINMKAVMTRWFNVCSKWLDVSSLNYADVAYLVAMRTIGDGHAWSVLATSCFMLLI